MEPKRLIAGSDIEAGQFVEFGTDGKLYPARQPRTHYIATEAIKPGDILASVGPPIADAEGLVRRVRPAHIIEDEGLIVGFSPHHAAEGDDVDVVDKMRYIRFLGPGASAWTDPPIPDEEPEGSWRDKPPML